MTEQEINRRVSRLEREIRYAGQQIERYMQRNPHVDIRRVAEGQMRETVGRFADREIGSLNEKTYDWYFNEDWIGDVYAKRNIYGHNRYFMIRQREVPLRTGLSTGETYVEEMNVWDAEISKIISEVPGLFSKMMEITVSEEEDQKISDVYDTIDEKSLVTIVVGVPVVLVLAVEALPAIYAYGQAAAPTMGKAFTTNSFSTGLFKGGSNLFGQLATNDFKFDNKIDYADPLISGFTGGWGSLIAESAFKMNINNEGVSVEYEGHQKFGTNLISNFSGNAAGKKLSNLSKPYTKLSPAMGSIMTELIGGSIIESGENILGDQINLGVDLVIKRDSD